MDVYNIYIFTISHLKTMMSIFKMAMDATDYKTWPQLYKNILQILNCKNNKKGSKSDK